MNEKKTPAELVWADGDGDRLWVRAPHEVPPTRSAAYVCASELGVFLTAAQCREVAAHFTALADADEHKDTSKHAAALTLTACAPPAPTETTAQVACEELVTDAVPNPSDLTFKHETTTRDGERWDVTGTARGGTLAGPLVYHCAVSFEEDGQRYRGHVWFPAEPHEGGDRP